MVPDTLRTDAQVAPLLLDSLHPFLSWHPPRDLDPVAAQFGWDDAQAGCSRWLPCTAPGLIWPGPPLTYDQRLRWRVRLRDASGRESGWSEWAACSSGPDPKRWPADWLAPPAQLGGPLLRADFVLDDSSIAEATWYVAHLGVPALIVNSDSVNGPGLADYQQDPRHGIEYRAWSVPATALRPGANTLAIELGGGFHERFGHGPRMLSSWLELRLADGAVRRIGRQAAEWRWRPGPTRGDAYDGECRDERLLPVGWDRPEGAGEPGWEPVSAAPAPAAPLHAARCPPPGIVAVHAPVRMEQAHDSCRLYDFGRAVCGAVRLRGNWRRGRVLTLRHGEEAEAGHLLIRGNRQALCTDRFTAGSPGSFTYLPSGTSRGFRHLELSCHGEWPETLAVEAVQFHDAAAPSAAFRCANQQVNDLFTACVDTFRQNLVGMLRDCPQRDERLGWLGDAWAVMPAILLCTDAVAVLRRWYAQIAAIQDPQRQFRCAPMAPMEPLHLTAWRQPTLPPLHTLGAADNAYTAAATLLVEQHVAATGDTRLALAHLAEIRAHLATWPQRADWPLIAASSHGDHGACAIDGQPARTAKELVSGLALLEEHRAAMRLASLLGEAPGELAARSTELEGTLRQRYATAFMDPASSQGTLAIGLEHGLTTNPAASAAALRQRLAADGHRLGTGILLTRSLLRALGRHGMAAEAWKLATQEGQPGWIWMLRAGPGTLHEHPVNSWPSSSRNQPALGVIAEWLLTDGLGLRRDDHAPPGRGWSWAPPDLPELPWAQGSVPTPYGPIRVAWRRESGTVQADIDAPAACGLRMAAPGQGR